MIAIVGIIAGILIVIDLMRNLRSGSVKTAFGTFSKEERPGAYRVVCAIKAALSFVALTMASIAIVQRAA